MPRGAGGEAEPDRASVASRGSYRAPDVTGAGSPTEGAGLQGRGPEGKSHWAKFRGEELSEGGAPGPQSQVKLFHAGGASSGDVTEAGLQRRRCLPAAFRPGRP